MTQTNRKKSRRVTIYEVAKEADVSLATVSRVINGSEVVKEPTRRKVEDAISRLGYKPNAIAQGLALSKTTSVGLIVPEASFSYVGQVINGLLDVAKIYKYNIMLHTINEGITDVESIVDDVIKSRVDGVIVYSDRITDRSISLLRQYNIPIVVISNRVSSDNICSVFVDIEKAIYELCSKYLSNGISDIAVVGDHRNINTTSMMLEGARRAFKEHDLKFDSEIRKPKNYHTTFHYLKDYFLDHKHQLVIANRDSQAMAVLNAARENGIRVPDEMEIVGVIDTKYNSMMRPQISSFSIPSYDLGAVSMRLLTKMLDAEEIADKEKCLKYLFTNRQTTKIY